MLDKTASRYFANSVKFIVTGVCLTLLLVACNKSGDKLAVATEHIARVNHGVQGSSNAVRPAWREAYLKFKRRNDADLAENERRIATLRKEVGKANTRFRASYNARIDELERRNNELRDRTDNYRDNGDGSWSAFKRGTRRDMDDLKSLLKKTTIKNH